MGKRKKTKQMELFGKLFIKKIKSKYSSKVATPIYTPSSAVAPKIYELADPRNTRKLIKKINESGVANREKEFLIHAAHRHTIFNYENIAEYYSHASKEMQQLMEDSALVVIDFDKAVEDGYVTLSEEIAKGYLNDHGDDVQEPSKS